jgi:2Fe-2S ferredoxin
VPKLIIQNLHNFEVPLIHTEKSLLYHIGEAGIDWMHACGAKGRCTTCKIRIVAGEGHLSPLSGPEIRFQTEGRLKNNERLACQCLATGDVVGEVPRESQLPHMQYGK